MARLKSIYFIIFIEVLLICPMGVAQDDTMRVLFVGNSHTYYNDLPQLFVDLSESGGHPAIKDMSAPGGYTLEQHASNSNTLSKIAQGIWDFVVLQEQSLYPVIDFYRFNSMYPYARYLDSMITSNSEQTALFMTWGWRYGGIHTINGHSSPDFVDYFHMQDSVSAAYNMLAENLNAFLVPAGNAWATAWAIDSSNSFWQSDTYHPTLPGSYLAACVFYARFYNESPVGLTFTAGLDTILARFLQSAAEQTALSIESDIEIVPSTHYLGQNYPNPFNGQTIIPFNLEREEHVRIEIFNVLGEKIETLINDDFNAGNYHATWNPASCPSGLYFYNLSAGATNQSRKMVLSK